MKIAVIGTGYVGLVAGVCLADLGNDVICADIDKAKVEMLNEGKVPIYEPGLAEMLKRNQKEDRIIFTTSIKDAIHESKAIFIAVGTPPGANHEADLTAIYAVAKDIGTYMDEYKVVIDKSTVPVGTAERVAIIIREHQKREIPFDVISNPEFLREGEAIGDFTNPDRIVVGTELEQAQKVMEEIYRGVVRTDKPILFTDVKSAEMIKYASNAMLATRISFMNEVAQLCEKVGADVKAVAKGMGLDTRIGTRFLQAGVGYGGSCFPKDVAAFRETMLDHNVEGQILWAVDKVNTEQKKSLLPKIKKLVPDLKGRKIAIWGLAFKPKTDDMREAPSIVIIEQLQKEGAEIIAFDPEAEDTAKKMLSDITYTKTPYEALEEVDALVIVTEWNEFRDLDKDKIKSLMKQPIVIDGRNVYEPREMRKKGFTYVGVGRG
ncbi:UDP-glucose/GDP-mannose dehydrogenase family protein [Candidatus Woesearchaeota archaeon]|nr:UDP-glucose/GDP-mannose dehydrogenase family protein [Candidatus Woesearchaeota archaeon]